MTHRGPFQPLLFCDSVKRSLALGAVLGGGPLSKTGNVHRCLSRSESGSVLQVLPSFCGRYLAPSFTPTGGQTVWVIAQKYTCEGHVPP